VMGGAFPSDLVPGHQFPRCRATNTALSMSVGGGPIATIFWSGGAGGEAGGGRELGCQAMGAEYLM
jgi:hypothetical protein